MKSAQAEDVDALRSILWSNRKLIAAVTIITTVIAVVVVLFLPNVYRAEALLSPNHAEEAGGLASLAAQYGGLARLTGIATSTTASDKIAVGLETLKSRKFISEFIKRRDILVPLIAAKGWDPRKDELLIDSDDYDVQNERWVRSVRAPKKVIPTAGEAYEEFREILTVNQDKKTGFVTLAVEFYSPTVAKQWVDWLVADINEVMMTQDVAEAEQAIKYLHEQIATTSLAELHGVFYRLIEEKTKTVMLAKVSKEYLLNTLDPAVAPERKSGPQRILFIGLTAVLTGFFMIFLTLIRGIRVVR